MNIVHLEDLAGPEKEHHRKIISEKEKDLQAFWKKNFKPLKGRMRDDFAMLGETGAITFDVAV